MKAVLCRAFGPPETLAFESVDPPPLGPGEVRIAVAAVGVNFPDLLLIEGKYQVRPPFPFSPGLECAGTVAELGPGAGGPAPGTRVLAYCTHGCMAEEVVAPASSVIPIPDAMPFDVAAAFPVVYGTGYHALVGRAALSRRRDAAGAGRLGRRRALGGGDRQAPGRHRDRGREQRREARALPSSTAPITSSTTARTTCASGSRR